uniref:BED-type domain-containing protein n=1 Tax=Cyprinus carpio TaxID=7962 RepID=A0A8C2DGG8_CYPCA
MHIVDEHQKKVSAVKCNTCDTLLKFDSAKTGTSHVLKHTRSCGKNVLTQSSVAPFLRLGVVPKKAKDANLEKCTKVCAKDLRAFSMFETTAFTDLAQMILDTGATHGRCNVKDLLPSGVTVSRFTQKKYESLRTELLPTVRKAIAEGLACGASTDVWTDDHRKVSYTCITLHYIDDAWEFNTRIICTCAFPSGAKKMALNLKTELLKQLGEFGLVPDEIDRLVFVSDQGANVQAALSQWVHKSCITHVLNTVLKHTFKKSKEGDEEHDGDEEESILLERGEMHRMSHISKDILQMLVQFLQPFKQATEELSGSKYCTINLVALWKTTLMTPCQISESQADPVPLRILKHSTSPQWKMIETFLVFGNTTKICFHQWHNWQEKYFVPASSVSCESAFSISGRTLENRRTCHSTASVNALLFLNSNM